MVPVPTLHHVQRSGVGRVATAPAGVAVPSIDFGVDGPLQLGRLTLFVALLEHARDRLWESDHALFPHRLVRAGLGGPQVIRRISSADFPVPHQ